MNRTASIPDALQTLRLVPGYGEYSVDADGNVYSTRKGSLRKLQAFKTNSGYMKLRLKKDGVGKGHYVHRLVAQAFIGDLGNLQVNHIDGNKLNNTADNLELVDRVKNMAHAKDSGLWNPANNKSEDRRIVPDDVVIAARAAYKKGQRGFGMRAMADKYGVSKTVMEGILMNRTYKEVA